MIIGYISMIYITNKYGAEEYGLYSLAFTVLSIIIIFPRFGFDVSLIRIIGEIKTYANKADILNIFKKTFAITIIIGFIFSFTLFLFSKEIATIVFNKSQFYKELRIVSFVVIPGALIFLIAAYFQAYKKIAKYMLMNSTLLNIFFFILLLFIELSDIQIKLFKVYAASICATFVFGLILLLKNISMLNKKLANTNGAKRSFTLGKIINISSPMLLSSSFVLLINWIDVIMIGIFSNEKSVGIYSASQRLAAITGIALFAINAISTPKFAEFFSKKDFIGLENTVVKSTKLIFFTTAPLLLIFVFLPKTILSINGPEFIAGYIALIFLCVGKFVNSISGSVGFILQMTNNQKIFKNVLMFSAILNASLNYFLIPLYDYNGAAFASLITIATWNIILVIIIKKKLGFWTIYIPFITQKNK